MKVSERSVLDRRSFIKGMLAAGATVTVAACAPVTVPAPVVPVAPVGPPTIVGPAWIHPKSLVRAVPGYGGAHLTWKAGDAVKWLPPEKYPADAAADTLARVPKAKLEEIYYKMTLSHQWETTFKDIRLSGKYTYGSFHPRVGQEAIPCTFYSMLNTDDYIISTHAGHHDLVGKGGKARGMSAEILERKTGYCYGYGGSMHLTYPPLGILGMNPIVGANPPMAAGAAWACKNMRKGQVVVSHIGDCAQQSRHWFNSVRSAVNYRLPVIFTNQNNFFGAGGMCAMQIPSPYLADMGAGLGLPCEVADGNSVAAVWVTARAAIDRARAGDPSYIEYLTYRWYDHSGFTGAKVGVDGSWGLPYKTDDEQRAWMARDPIVRMGTFLVDRGLFSRAELDALIAKAKAEVDESIVFSEASPLTRPEDGAKHQWPFQESLPATQFFEHKVIL